MREIASECLREAVKKLFIEASYILPDSLCKTVDACAAAEHDELARSILGKLRENREEAVKIDVPVCQDTGMAVLFVELGEEVRVTGGHVRKIIDEGVADAYRDGFLRKSVVRDPLFDRTNTNDNSPAVVHFDIVPGDHIRLTAAPKGFGSENMSKTKMFKPTASKEDIVAFVTDTVKEAGSNPCPPVVVGVGLGGTFEYAALLAKKALTRDVGSHHVDARYAALEDEMLRRINALNIGPQGFGGNTTALGVMIETYPTHIAGLPCAVNIGCHVTRHASMTI